MKLIYITGASCCGKTTLAKKLINNGNTAVLSLDALSKSIRTIFIDFKLYTDEISIKPAVNSDKFLMLVKKYIECYFDDYDNTLIVEGCHFSPLEFLKEFPQAKVIALGITDKNTALRRIDKKEWMAGLPEEMKNEYARLITEYSQYLKDNANRFSYYETI